jgi:hypothetical protein
MPRFVAKVAEWYLSAMTQTSQSAAKSAGPASPLLSAMRVARIEAAERSGVVVDLHDAQLARLEILNEELDRVFAEIAANIDLFDRGLSHGDPPRLWIDMVAHIVMGPDKRLYRFVQDTRLGRRTLAESPHAEVIVKAVTGYVARRIIERERALAADAAEPATAPPDRALGIGLFLLGTVAGAAALFAAAWFLAPKL